MERIYLLRECKAVLLENLSALWPTNKTRKRTRRGFVARRLDYRQRLIDRLMQLLGNQRPASLAFLTQRQRDDRDVDVSRLGVLQRLPDVVAEDKLRFHPIPNARTLQRLLRGEPVRRVIRISNRNAFDLGPREVHD